MNGRLFTLALSLLALVTPGCNLERTPELHLTADEYVQMRSVPSSLGDGHCVVVGPVGLRRSGNSLFLDYVLEGPEPLTHNLTTIVGAITSDEPQMCLNIQSDDGRPVHLKNSKPVTHAYPPVQWLRRQVPGTDRWQIFATTVVRADPFPGLGVYSVQMLEHPSYPRILSVYREAYEIAEGDPLMRLDESWQDAELIKARVW